MVADQEALVVGHPRSEKVVVEDLVDLLVLVLEVEDLVDLLVLVLGVGVGLPCSVQEGQVVEEHQHLVQVVVVVVDLLHLVPLQVPEGH